MTIARILRAAAVVWLSALWTGSGLADQSTRYRVLLDVPADSEDRVLAYQRLETDGIQATEDGLYLRAGEFEDEQAAEERMLDLLGLGFVSVRIIRVDPDGPEEDTVADDDDRDVLVFGDADDNGDADEGSEPGLPSAITPHLDDLRVTAGYLPRDRQPVETYQDATISGSLRWRPGGAWEGRLGARLDAQRQTARDRDEVDVETSWGSLDYTENWLRYRAAWGRVTVGTQVIPWGTMDLLPPGDRLSVQDLTRGPLEPIDDARRASPSLRFEAYGPVDLDAVITPVFRPAELPREGTLWHPVDERRGRLLGVPDEPIVRALVQGGSFEHEPRGRDQDVVGGIRLSRTARALDWGVTVQSARHSGPYYALSDDAREALGATGDPAAAVAADGDTFIARHPRSLIAGGDVSLDAAGATWRFEAVWSSDEPATRETDLRYVTRRGVHWATSAELFPGDADLRVSLQLTGEHLLDASDVLDPVDTYQVSGEIEQPWARERWHARLRFNVGLDRSDIYLNPELVWSATDTQDVTLAGHYFSGADDTLGGYFEDSDIVTLGWRLYW